ncbi:hypothetical protein, partial [uncultured Dialister sp.]|uniref:hypothetical protein n=1 Tax=uncultured Dialister sp. TaxID=278064 RepID=UPI00265CAD5A
YRSRKPFASSFLSVREASAYYRSRKPFASSFLSVREASVYHSRRKPFVEAQKYLSFSVNFSPITTNAHHFSLQ